MTTNAKLRRFSNEYLLVYIPFHRYSNPKPRPSGVSRRLWRRWTASGDSLTEDSNSPEAQRNELLRQRVEELAGDRRQAVAKLKAHEICDALCGHTVQRLLPLVDDSAEKSKAESSVLMMFAQLD